MANESVKSIPTPSTPWFQFTLGQLGIFVLVESLTLLASLRLTNRDPLESAVNLLQVAVVCYVLSVHRRATWPGGVAGAVLSAGDSLWTAHCAGGLPEGKVVLFWASYMAWFGAGASGVIRGQLGLGMTLMTSALLWLAMVFAGIWMWAR